MAGSEGKETAAGSAGGKGEVAGAAPGSADGRAEAVARLGRLLEERGLTLAWLARESGVSRSVVSYWFRGGRLPRAASLARAARALGVSPWWLIYGREDAASGHGPEGAWIAGSYACVCEYAPARAGGAGRGRPALAEREHGEKAAYALGNFSRRRLDPSKCRRIRAGDGGMEPLIRGGDMVLVDGSDTGVQVRGWGIYCLDWGRGPRVRRLRRAGDGGLAARCLNPAYGDESFTAEEAERKVRIYGRVVERSGWL